VAFFNVGDGSAALVDCREKIPHVPARRGRGVQLDVCLSQILGILLLLINAFEVDRFGLSSSGMKSARIVLALRVPFSP